MVRSALIFIVLALASCSTPSISAPRRAPDDAPPPKGSRSRDSVVVADVTLIELSSYHKAGQNWRDFLVPRSIGQIDLMRVARRLHASDADSSFRFFTDDSRYEEFK